jgi:LemA protein
MEPSLIATIAISAISILYIISIFNKLVALRNRFKNSFAQIEVQLKRRYDLIPNLIETAKGYLNHEKETLTAVTEARNAAANALSDLAAKPDSANAVKQLSQAEAMLQSSLGNLNLVMEAYPDLKSNQNMMQLSEEITGTENKVSFARQAYNDQVMAYNTYKQSFPQIIFAKIFGHGPDSELLEFEDSKLIQDAPKVSF